MTYSPLSERVLEQKSVPTQLIIGNIFMCIYQITRVWLFERCVHMAIYKYIFKLLLMFYWLITEFPNCGFTQE